MIAYPNQADDLGRRAVEHVLALLDDPETIHEPEVVPPELVVRASTAARP